MWRQISLGMVLAAFGLAGCDLHDMEGERDFDAPIDSVVADLDGANIAVRPSLDGRASVEFDLEGIGDRPEFDARLEGTTLVIDLACDWECRGQIDVRVPAAADLDIDLSSGSITVEDIEGDVAVRTDAGNVDGRGLRARRCSAETDAGHVVLELIERPVDVEAETDAGSVKITVPAGTYDIHATSSAGSTHVRGLNDDPDAPDSITAHSSAGNVTIEGR